MRALLRRLAATALAGAVGLGSAWGQGSAVASDFIRLGPADQALGAFGNPYGCRTIGLAPFSYPLGAARFKQSGRVLAMAVFDGPDMEPSVTVLNDVGSPSLHAAARQALSKVRIQCRTPGQSWPVRAIQLFHFRFDDSPRRVYPAVWSLGDVMRGVVALDQHKVRFDLDGMSCPFDVRLTLYQPYLPNVVEEVGSPDPRRAKFLQWLSTVRLRIPAETLSEVLGDTIRVSVPCGVLDLTS